ncbi:hypothetical protein ACJIZ3_019880 [Penstemon smallii]|uniref:Uncharacterized protein n=1 Tax=Penstemon smallii TaxID=265156 RepID=A0ABD3T3Z5_9LAMI
MNAGEGQHSYVKNSSYQRGVVDVAKPIIEEEIAKKLDVENLSSFHLADYGCSTGHNSFPAMQIIIEAITKKIEQTSIKVPEFFVFFNDNITNDFNTLFGSVSPEDHYHVIGLPGSFHNQLLPKSSLHFGYSSWSLQWLSEVPKELSDCKSPAWNKGAIFYSGDKKDKVYEAYLNQYAKGLGSFLDARAQELVSGGMLALLIPAAPTFWDPQTEYTLISDLNLMGSCLVDMVKKGIIDEAKVDEFNLPYYFATPEQLKGIIENNNKYSIERLEILNNPGKHTLPNVTGRAAFFRAVHEKLLGDHFGSVIIDELFDRYMKKLSASSLFVNSANDKSLVTLIVLKLKQD